MARRRYLSTSVSTDRDVNRLATECGDFAVVLYTWMIPHAGDDGRLTGDPDEILMTVLPGRRDKQPADVETALRCMVGLGLIEWDGATVAFPCEAFYRYQTYIKPQNRRADEPSAPAESSDEPSATPESAENADEQRETPQNTASFPLSVPVPVSVSPSHPPREYDEGGADAPGDEPPEPDVLDVWVRETATEIERAPFVADEYEDICKGVRRAFELVSDFQPRGGPALAALFAGWKGYKSKPPENWYLAWVKWLRRELTDGPKAVPRNANQYAQPADYREDLKRRNMKYIAKGAA